MYSVLSDWQKEKSHKYKTVILSNFCAQSQIFPPVLTGPSVHVQSLQKSNINKTQAQVAFYMQSVSLAWSIHTLYSYTSVKYKSNIL